MPYEGKGKKKYHNLSIETFAEREGGFNVFTPLLPTTLKKSGKTIKTILIVHVKQCNALPVKYYTISPYIRRWD